MASATMEAFCCNESSNKTSVSILVHLNTFQYNTICIVSALFGMIGASYQILPYGEQILHRKPVISGHRQRRIIGWLALADLLASIGIIVRSISWLSTTNYRTYDSSFNRADQPFCIAITGWIHYFYTVTFMWTLCYAIDVYLTCKQKAGNPKIYHFFSWTLPALLTIVGLGTLYSKDFRCHCAFWRVLINYLTSYIPIVMVMIINPILYCLASQQVRVILTSRLGQFTDHERSVLAAVREKFFFIVLVFYVCWLPNILNGFILWAMWLNLPRSVIATLWYIMALINPLQAVLNSLVYRGWEQCTSYFSVLLSLCKRSVKQSLFINPTSSMLDQSWEERSLLSRNSDM